MSDTHRLTNAIDIHEIDKLVDDVRGLNINNSNANDNNCYACCQLTNNKYCSKCGACPFCGVYHNAIGKCEWCIMHGIRAGDDITTHDCDICTIEYDEQKKEIDLQNEMDDVEYMNEMDSYNNTYCDF